MRKKGYNFFINAIMYSKLIKELVSKDVPQH